MDRERGGEGSGKKDNRIVGAGDDGGACEIGKLVGGRFFFFNFLEM